MNKFWRLYIKLRYMAIPEGRDGDLARGKLYRPFLKNCGKYFKVASQAFIYEPNALSVGDYVYIGFNAYIGSGKEITFDDGVTIGPFSVVVASSRTRERGSFRTGHLAYEPVYIGKGTQVASHTVITSGVSIGKGCVVGAGSVVTKSFGDDVLIAGVPGTVVKHYDKEQNPVYTY